MLDDIAERKRRMEPRERLAQEEGLAREEGLDSGRSPDLIDTAATQSSLPSPGSGIWGSPRPPVEPPVWPGLPSGPPAEPRKPRGWEIVVRLVAMCARLPEVASEALARRITGHLSYLHATEGMQLFWRLVAERVQQHGPDILTRPGWQDWLRRAIETYLGGERSTDADDLRGEIFGCLPWGDTSLWGLAFGPGSESFMVEEGRELVKEVVHRGIVEELRRAQVQGLEDGPAVAAARFIEAAGQLTDLDGDGTEAFRYDAQAHSCAELDALDLRHEWLVEDLLVRDEPVVIGGTRKGLKTTIAIDLAVSLATATPFLGHFPVPGKKRVLFVSGESGRKTTADTARRICQARKVAFAGCDIDWQFKLPRLSDDADLLLLGRVLRQRRSEVVFIDPTYLTLQGSRRPIDTNNSYQIGPVLMRAVQVCASAGAQVVLCHHVSRGMQRAKAASKELMDLEDLSGAGVAEVARQWVILTFLEPYDPDTGRCKLGVVAGSSAVGGTRFVVDIDQGVRTRGHDGRHWSAHVEPWQAAVEQMARDREDARHKQQQARKAAQREAVRDFLHGRPQGALQTEIAQLAGVNKNEVGPLLNAMLRDLEVVRSVRPGDKPSWRRWKERPFSFPCLVTEQMLAQLREGVPIEEVLAAVPPAPAAGGDDP